MSASRPEVSTVANVLDGDGDVDWKAVIDLLREGKTVEIPCERERDYVRRATQAAKRAENRGITVEVVRGEGVLRVEPRSGLASGAANAEAEPNEESQLERHQRREARRAERIAERGQDA